MRYSDMTADQRRVLLDDPERYPLRVIFLGKAAILSYEELAFLRQRGVDFEIDRKQAEEAFLEKGVPVALPSTVANVAGLFLALLRLFRSPRS